MIGTTRASKQPAAKGKTGVFATGGGRWAYYRDGLVCFVCCSEEDCRERAKAAGYRDA